METNKFKADYTLTQDSSDLDIIRFKEDISIIHKKSIRRGMLPLLLKALKSGYVTKIKVRKPSICSLGPNYILGYFYFYTIEDGVFAPNDIMAIRDRLRINIKKSIEECKDEN